MGVRFWRPLDFGTLGVREFGISAVRDFVILGVRDFVISGVRESEVVGFVDFGFRQLIHERLARQ